MADLAKLVVKLEAQTAQYQAELEKAKRKLGSFETDVVKMAGKIGTAIGTFAVAGAGAFTALVKNAVDSADKFDEMGQKIAVSAASLSSLEYAAKMNGVAFETLTGGFAKLAKSAADAADGTGEQAKAFKALGVSVLDNSGKLKGSEQLFDDVADAMSHFEDGPAKIAVAMALLGKSGAELIPLMNQGKKGLEDYRLEAEKLGITISDKTAAAAGQFNDNLDRLRAMVEGVSRRTAAALLPTLQAVSDQFVANLKDSDAVSRGMEVLATSFKLVASAGVIVTNIFQAVGKWSGAVAAGLVAIHDFDFKALKSVSASYWSDLKEDFSDVTNGVEKIWAANLTKIEDKTTASAGKILPALRYGFGDGAKLAKPVKDAADQVEKILKDLEEKAATLGMSADDISLRQLQQLGASAEQLQRAQQALTKSSDYDKQQERIKALSDEYERNIELITGVDSATRAYQAQIADLNDLVGAGKINWEQYNKAVMLAQDAYDAAEKSAKDADDIIGELNRNLARRIQDDLAQFLFDPFDEGLKGMIKSFGQTIQKILADAAAAQITKALFGNTSSSGGGSGGFFGAALGAIGSYFTSSGGGAKALGGSVAAGAPYLVGERGPELFVPDRSGDIVPHHALQSRSPVTINMSVQSQNGYVSPQTMNQVAAAAARGLAMASQRNN